MNDKRTSSFIEIAKGVVVFDAKIGYMYSLLRPAFFAYKQQSLW